MRQRSEDIKGIIPSSTRPHSVGHLCSSPPMLQKQFLSWAYQCLNEVQLTQDGTGMLLFIWNYSINKQLRWRIYTHNILISSFELWLCFLFRCFSHRWWKHSDNKIHLKRLSEEISKLFVNINSLILLFPGEMGSCHVLLSHYTQEKLRPGRLNASLQTCRSGSGKNKALPRLDGAHFTLTWSSSPWLSRRAPARKGEGKEVWETPTMCQALAYIHPRVTFSHPLLGLQNPWELGCLSDLPKLVHQVRGNVDPTQVCPSGARPLSQACILNTEELTLFNKDVTVWGQKSHLGR